MDVRACAKINITLDVLRKREDGFHEVQMIMQAVSLYDHVHLEWIPEGITVSTNVKFLPVDNRNIAYRAAELFLRTAGRTNGVGITIRKNIPVAAGLAGGSANAAAVLKGLNRMCGGVFSLAELKEIGAQLGSDVPYCIEGGTRLAEGRGEVLTRLPDMPRTVFLIAKPHLHVSTPWVYKNLAADRLEKHPDTQGCIRALEQKNVRGVASRMMNVLETVTIPAYPVIQQYKQKMMECGCVNAVMSGSGPTVIGLYSNIHAAFKAEKVLRKLSREVFLVHTLNYGITD